MGRMVCGPIVTQTFGTGSGGDDVFELGSAATNKVRLHGFEIYSNQTTAEAVSLRLLRRTTTGNGSAVTEALLDPDDSAITSAMEVNATTPGTADTVLMHFEWEQLGPLVFWPTPAAQPVLDVSSFLCLELIDNLAASQVWQGFVVWEEF